MANNQVLKSENHETGCLSESVRTTNMAAPYASSSLMIASDLTVAKPHLTPYLCCQWFHSQNKENRRHSQFHLHTYSNYLSVKYLWLWWEFPNFCYLHSWLSTWLQQRSAVVTDIMSGVYATVLTGDWSWRGNVLYSMYIQKRGWKQKGENWTQWLVQSFAEELKWI